VAVALQVLERVLGLEVLKLDYALGPLGRHRLHELVAELLVLLAVCAGHATAEVERVLHNGLGVTANVQLDGKRARRLEPAARAVQVQLADRDAHPTSPQVPEAQDPPPVRNDDDVWFQVPVVQDGADLVLVFGDGDVHAGGGVEDLPKALAGFANRRSIQNREQLLHVLQQHLVEEGGVGAVQRLQVDVLVDHLLVPAHVLHRAGHLVLQSLLLRRDQPQDVPF